MSDIQFFTQDISFKVPKPFKTRQWIRSVVLREKRELSQINYIFCSDDYLASLNKEYLNHRTLTDIITFDHNEEGGAIEGDIFISIDRVRENASILEIPFEDELHRVMVHGVLHLTGHNDKNPAQKLAMRKREDRYLSLRDI